MEIFSTNSDYLITSAANETLPQAEVTLSRQSTVLRKLLVYSWFVICAGGGAMILNVWVSTSPQLAVPLVPLYFAIWITLLYFGRRFLLYMASITKPVQIEFVLSNASSGSSVFSTDPQEVRTSSAKESTVRVFE